MITRSFKINTAEPEPHIIKEAADVIKNRGLVVFPTETVYGLGADATDSEAAEKIYFAKGRPSDNPLIIHISKPADAEKYAYTNEIYYTLTEKFSPGPLTIILKKKDIIPNTTSGGLDTVAVRIPDNIIARALIEQSGVAIAAPSANTSGKPSPTKAEHASEDLDGKVDMILDGGDCRVGVESTIVSVTDGNILVLRPGGVTVEQLESLGYSVILDKGLLEAPKNDFRPLAPGMKYRHYAPKADVYLLDGDECDVVSFMLSAVADSSDVGLICYEDMDISGEHVKYISRDINIAASELFDILRYFDKTNIKTVYSVIPTKDGIGLAVNNRLLKAAGFKMIKLSEILQ